MPLNLLQQNFGLVAPIVGEAALRRLRRRTGLGEDEGRGDGYRIMAVERKTSGPGDGEARPKLRKRRIN